MQNVEIGADQEVVSSGSVGSASQQRLGSLGSVPGLNDVFVEQKNLSPAAFDSQRWDDMDSEYSDDLINKPDRLPGARPLFEGIDYSGNVAITGPNAKFGSSNADVNATLGIRCNTTPGACFPNPSSPNSYFNGATGDPEQDLNTLAGISTFDPATLNAGLAATRDFIVGLQTDAIFTKDAILSSSAYDPLTGLPQTMGEATSG